MYEGEAKHGGPLAESTQHARTLLTIVRISTWITIDEFPVSAR